MSAPLRDALGVLDRPRLDKLAARLAVELPQRATKADIIEALVQLPPSADQLDLHKRDELKKVCRALGLDDSGKAKAELVERILGTAEPPTARTAHKAPRARKGKSGRSDAASAASKDEEEGWTSSTKARLRRFTLAAAAGYRSRDADAEFARDLIRCFGWGPDEALPGEIPAVVAVVEKGERKKVRLSALLRERRAVVQVIDREQAPEDAWKDLLPLVLQLNPVPQYVVLSNQRDIHLYDLARDRVAVRLSLALDQLPKYSEAFPFLARDWSPGATPKIINVERVSKEVADLVAKVYRSFKADHPDRQDDVIRFTLQCIIAMFAEDIGLLPQEHFTTLLWQAAEAGDAERRLRELFRLMSTPQEGERAIRYFNGGLFANPVVFPVGKSQLSALTKAAEANWKDVDPHIFGNVFQGIMDDDERHASGAHYTAKEDIMRVVGPTIVEPWRKRINAASSLTELRSLRVELAKFRVLDPACGSGNFLYVAFRELYRLETELLARMREYPSVADDPKARGAWGSGIRTTNFYGIDINPFAVELARTTLNIAKKIAFDERRELVFERFGQREMEIDPSLPLDNLEANIVRGDALFVEWPEVEAIVGNPPFLGAKWIRTELGAAYVGRLKERYPNIGGDMCVYWFRRAHERLLTSGRAGLVGTSGIRVGTSREAALDYIVENGGTITNAVSERQWPGEAVVHVSMVNWVKGIVHGPKVLIVGDRAYGKEVILPHLQLQVDVAQARDLAANKEGTSQGVTFGTKAFYLGPKAAAEFRAESSSAPFVRPVCNGSHLLGGRLELAPEYVIQLGGFESEAKARSAGRAYQYLRKHVLPIVRSKAEEATTSHYQNWLKSWWRPFWHREDFFRTLVDKSRVIVCSRVASRPIFVFLSTEVVPVDKLQIFAFDDDYSFGILQSSLHWQWVLVRGGRLKADFVYSTAVWKTFPWPQGVSEDHVAAVAGAARELRSVRAQLRESNGWTLRELYRSAETEGTHLLKSAQAALDEAVAEAYGMSHGQDSIAFLLELNLCLAEDEDQGHELQGAGLPSHLDPGDHRWSSTDCIRPPDPSQENSSG